MWSHLESIHGLLRNLLIQTKYIQAMPIQPGEFESSFVVARVSDVVPAEHLLTRHFILKVAFF